MTEHEELKALLHDMSTKLQDVSEKLNELPKIRGDLITLVSRIDAIEPELSSLKKVAEAAATVAGQTHVLVNELHTAVIDTADRHGARIYALENPNGHANGKAR